MSDDTQGQPESAVEPVEPIAYHFAPANPGESFVSLGIPARDLTQRDWDRLTPEQQRAATTKGPKGAVMYQKVSKADQKATKAGATGAAGPGSN